MAVKKAFYNIIDLKGNQIQGVGAPSADTDAATKISAQGQADAAEAAAIAAAALDATSKADTAQAAAATYTDGKITDLVNGAPAVLDTLNELAVALGNDENFSTTITTLIGTKASIATGSVTGAGTSTANGYEYTVTHSLGKANVLVQVYDGNDVVEVFVRKIDNNSLKIITGAALGSTSLSVVVVG